MRIEFSQELFDAICDRIANGESLRSICKDADMPNAGSVCRWMAQDESGLLGEQYARARQAQAEVIADEVVDIADSEEDPAKARVRIDARKWYAGKMKPKVYGDKIDVNHSGEIARPITGFDLKVVSSAPPGDTDAASG